MDLHPDPKPDRENERNISSAALATQPTQVTKESNHRTTLKYHTASPHPLVASCTKLNTFTNIQEERKATEMNE